MPLPKLTGLNEQAASSFSPKYNPLELIKPIKQMVFKSLSIPQFKASKVTLESVLPIVPSLL